MTEHEHQWIDTTTLDDAAAGKQRLLCACGREEINGKPTLKRRPPPPAWCAKPKPCDFDRLSAWCPHRECREKLIAQHAEGLTAQAEAAFAQSNEHCAHAHSNTDRCGWCQRDEVISALRVIVARATKSPDTEQQLRRLENVVPGVVLDLVRRYLGVIDGG